MICLTVDEVILLHEKLIQSTGGAAGLRDRGLLESAVWSATIQVGNVEPYPTAEESRPAGLRSCLQPSLFGRKQACWNTGHAYDAEPEWCSSKLHTRGIDLIGFGCGSGNHRV